MPKEREIIVFMQNHDKLTMFLLVLYRSVLGAISSWVR